MVQNTVASKLRIAIILVSNGFAGAEKVVWQTLSALNNSFDFFLITNDEIVHHFTSVVESSRIFNVGSMFGLREDKFREKLVKNSLYSISDFHLYRKSSAVIRFINDNNIKVVHCHLESSLYLGRLVKGPLSLIYTVHDVLRFNGPKRPLGFIKTNKLRRNMKSVDTAVFVSNYARRIYREQGIVTKKEAVIYNGLDLDELSGYRKLSSVNEIPNILFVGGDKFVKGGDIFVEALVLIIERNLDLLFNVTLLGNYSKSSKMMQIIEDGKLKGLVRIVGFISPPHHLHYFSVADLLVLPSRSEAQPLAILEALNFGLPIIASNVGGIPELITDEVNGLLCSPDAYDLSLKIERLLLDHALRARIFSANISRGEIFSLVKMEQKLRKVYLESCI